MARTSAYSASGTTFNKILKTSCETYATHVNVSQETHRANASVHDYNYGEDQSAITLLSELCNSRLPRVLNNPCGLIGMLNVDEGVVLVDNRLKILQR